MTNKQLLIVFNIVFLLSLLAVVLKGADWSTVAEQAINAPQQQQAQYQEQLLYNLTHDRGISFNSMVQKDSKEQKVDPVPQAHSFAVFLIAKGGRKRFGDCLREARLDRRARKWNRTFQRHYGMNLNQLQVAWVDWVRTNQAVYAICPPGGT